MEANSFVVVNSIAHAEAACACQVGLATNRVVA
jgi:hypothetical protein